MSVEFKLREYKLKGCVYKTNNNCFYVYQYPSGKKYYVNKLEEVLIDKYYDRKLPNTLTRRRKEKHIKRVYPKKKTRARRSLKKVRSLQKSETRKKTRRRQPLTEEKVNLLKNKDLSKEEIKVIKSFYKIKKEKLKM